jgi:hypothetical protein
VEVKAVNLEREKSFSFSSLHEKQRRWLMSWYEDGGQGYLAIGTVNERPRRLWIIDWAGWLFIEGVLSEHQMSIPVDVDSGRYLKVLKRMSLDLVNLGEKYQLYRQKGGWALPDGHSLERRW